MKKLLLFSALILVQLISAQQDIDFTIKAKKILNELEINLLDHIIVSDTGNYSFLENEII